MEEKKLNGEEIISALKFAIAQGAPDGIGFWNNDMKWCEFSMCDVLDLIQRQKAEIERLTKENGNISQSYIEVCDINAELQKQVDELKFDKEILQKLIDKREKDTAKEIYTQVLEWLPVGEDYSVFIHNIEQWLKEKYGVEVEG